MKEEEYEQEIRAIAEGGRITCKEAMKLAARLGVPTREMADLLDKYQVKIMECQLGCFK